MVINLGTNDSNQGNGGGVVSDADYTTAYIKLINHIHEKYPKAQVIAMQIWQGFSAYGNTYQQIFTYDQATLDAVAHFQNDTDTNFMHYFNTTGILQHNDISPVGHLTDVAAAKVSSHLMQFVKLTFEWSFAATGPKVFHDTLYWNNEVSY